MNRSLATAIVGHHYPGQTVVAVEPVSAGHRPTAVVRFADRSPVVVQRSESVEAVRTEAALVRAVCDRTAVPVPPVLATGRHDGRAYAIREHRHGTDLHNTFADSDDHGWLAAYGRRAVERLPPDFDPLRARLSDCLDTATDVEVTPRLFPWDLRPGNALAIDGAVSAVLDWERPMAAPPALALAKTEYLVADWYVDDPAPLHETFREGYESVRPLPTVGPVHRVVAIADSAVDSRGDVTNPQYPDCGRSEAVAFHREALERALGT